MNNSFSFPWYAKFSFIIVGAFTLISILYIGQHIIVPLIYATVLAILLNPLVNFLIKYKINKIIAISFAVIFAIILLTCLLYFISAQISMFGETYPKLKEKFLQTTTQLIHWTSNHFSIKQYKIDAWIEQNKTDTFQRMGGAIGQTLATLNSVLIIVFLLPVYLFMILYYKYLLLEFIKKLFRTTYHIAVFDVLISSKKIIQSYLIGLFFEAIIIAVLNSVGLLILGINYAIILGITGALLNVIPYIGGVMAIVLPMIVAYVTKESSTYALLVFVIYIFIQFIDNHFIIPRIVASRVKLNALISIIAVLAGSALWGIPGMFLSIPLTAIIKVVFDHIDSLKPWGFLLGNTIPSTKINFKLK